MLNISSTTVNASVSNAIESNCTTIPALVDFHQLYGSIHVYITLVWCPLGVFSNIINIIVLNQKRMRTPTNFLLTCLAVSDAVLMFLYVIFESYFVVGNKMRSSPYPMAVYLLFQVNLQNMLHVFSCGVIVTLAVFRLMYARCLLKCQTLCSQRRAEIAVFTVLLTATCFTIPCMIGHRVESASADLGPGDLELITVAHKNLTQTYTVNYVQNDLIRAILYWNTAIFVKLLPLVSLIVLSSLLIASINQRVSVHKRSNQQQQSGSVALNKQVARRPSALRGDVAVSEVTELSENPLEKVLIAEKLRDRSHNRTTRMLLSIMLVYIITYLPQVSCCSYLTLRVTSIWEMYFI